MTEVAINMYKQNSIKNVLVSLGLVSEKDQINISPLYINDANPQCYIVTCKSKNICKIRFQKKGHENAIKTEQTVLEFLIDKKIQGIPKLIYPLSNNDNIDFLVTSYIEGHDISFLDNDFEDFEMQNITEQLIYIIKKLHSLHSAQYNDFRTITFNSWNKYITLRLKEKIKFFLDNPLQRTLFLDYFLKLSKYDVNFESDIPVLIHFDLKPANIIYNKSKNKVSLIDFEMARFSDIYFGYSKADFCAFLYPTKTFKNIILPTLLQNELGITINEFRNQDKYFWYMLYHWITYINYLNSTNCPISKFYYQNLVTVLYNLLKRSY